MYSNSSASIYLKVKYWKILFKIKNKIRVTALSTSIQHWKLNILASPVRQEKKELKIQGLRIKKIFVDDVIVSIENPREATDKLLELLTESNKLSGTKFIYKNSSHFCT